MSSRHKVHKMSATGNTQAKGRPVDEQSTALPTASVGNSSRRTSMSHPPAGSSPKQRLNSLYLIGNEPKKRPSPPKADPPRHVPAGDPGNDPDKPDDDDGDGSDSQGNPEDDASYVDSQGEDYQSEPEGMIEEKPGRLKKGKKQQGPHKKNARAQAPKNNRDQDRNFNADEQDHQESDSDDADDEDYGARRRSKSSKINYSNLTTRFRELQSAVDNRTGYDLLTSIQTQLKINGQRR